MNNSLGFYRSHSVAGIYQIPLSGPNENQQLRDVLESSLQAIITKQPGLCFAISHETKSSAHLYQQLQTIDLEDVARFVDVECDADDEDSLQRALVHEVEAIHSAIWQPGRPAWKATFICSSVDKSTARVAVSFAAHHAIADGMSGRAFHASLKQELDTALRQGSRPSWPLQLPSTPRVPTLIDDIIDFNDASLRVAEAAQKPVWGGPPIPSTIPDDFKSRVRFSTFSSQEVSRALAVSKQRGVSLTNLLHGIICISLRRSLRDKNVPAFRSGTPYSLRRFTGASPQAIVNHMSFRPHYTPGSVLDQAARCEEYSPQEEEYINQLAREHRDAMADELARFPKGNVWIGVTGVDDVEGSCRARLGGQRDSSFEFSNLGSLEVKDGSLSKEGGIPCVSLEKLVFSQCGQVAGASLAFNCVSIRGGPMTLCISWQDGTISESLVDEVKKGIQDRIRRYANAELTSSA